MAPNFKKLFVRIGSLNCRGKLAAHSQELHGLLKRRQVDILGVQEVNSHLPISVQGYSWLPGLDKFTRPTHHLGIGCLVKKELNGLVNVVHTDPSHEFMWLKLAGRGSTQDTFVCVAYCLTQKHSVEKRRDMYASLLETCSRYQSKGEVLLVGDFNARLGSITGDKDTITSNGKLLQSFLHSAFADGESGAYLSLLNTAFDCKGLPTRCENGRTSIIDYLITAPESLHRVLDVEVQCHDQFDGANALGSDHHLLYVDWKLLVDAPQADCSRRTIAN